MTTRCMPCPGLRGRPGPNVVSAAVRSVEIAGPVGDSVLESGLGEAGHGGCVRQAESITDREEGREGNVAGVGKGMEREDGIPQVPISRPSWHPYVCKDRDQAKPGQAPSNSTSASVSSASPHLPRADLSEQPPETAQLTTWVMAEVAKGARVAVAEAATPRSSDMIVARFGFTIGSVGFRALAFSLPSTVTGEIQR